MSSSSETPLPQDCVLGALDPSSGYVVAEASVIDTMDQSGQNFALDFSLGIQLTWIYHSTSPWIQAPEANMLAVLMVQARLVQINSAHTVDLQKEYFFSALS